MSITFHRRYEGCYKMNVDGAIAGHIDKSMDGDGWNFEGRHFKYLSEAKTAAKDQVIQFGYTDMWQNKTANQ